MIVCKNVTYKYENADKNALAGVNLRIKKGEFVAIVGANGSGKSTLAKHFNALLLPLEGSCTVGGIDTKDEARTFEVRAKCGMVFQNPDNQIVSGVVEEDVAFAAENLGLPSEEIRRRVDFALETVGMTEYVKHAPHLLSGGQKQRVAIAGILAMSPECVVLDEPTAMLDPKGRKSVLKILKRLHSAGKTIVLITHNMNEAILADRIVVMKNGEIVMSGTPKEVFDDAEAMENAGLELTQTAELMRRIGRSIALTVEEALNMSGCKTKTEEKRCGRAACSGEGSPAARFEMKATPLEKQQHRPMIELKNVSYTYSPKTPFEKKAVDAVGLTVNSGEILGIIGHTGSGKSTLIQMMNGLLLPTEGEVFVGGKKVEKVAPDVGMVFQYPENQIFEETIRAEIGFGPRNMGVPEEEIGHRIEEVSEMLEIEDIERSPHFLSGGQQRRVAIASILAMKPHTIIFDEPTAGLDPRAKNHLIALISQLNAQGATIVLVSHSMEDIAKISHRVAVMQDAKIAMIGTPAEVFARADELVGMGLDVPEITRLMRGLGHDNCWTVERAVEILC